MLLQLFAVGAGGFFGAIFRSLSLLFFTNRLGLSSVFGVLFVNVLGSFIAGFFICLPESMQGSYLKYFIITGFLGALTTFSAFSLDNMGLLRQGEYKMLAINIILNVVLTLLFVSLGYTLSKKVFG